MPYAGGKGIEREVGNLGSVPEVIESLDSRSGGVSFNISWILRSDCLTTIHRINNYNIHRLRLKITLQSFSVTKLEQSQAIRLIFQTTNSSERSLLIQRSLNDETHHFDITPESIS